MNTATAKFVGRCPVCGCRFLAGEKIACKDFMVIPDTGVRVKGQWGHLDCMVSDEAAAEHQKQREEEREKIKRELRQMNLPLF